MSPEPEPLPPSLSTKTKLTKAIIITIATTTIFIAKLTEITHSSEELIQLFWATNFIVLHSLPKLLTITKPFLNRAPPPFLLLLITFFYFRKFHKKQNF